MPIERVVRLDGVKWVARDVSWALMRPSATEPVARVYVEARSRVRLERLRACRRARLRRANARR